MNPLNTEPTRSLIPPADFPVAWASPDDARYHWTRDREHTPMPLTPMYSTVAGRIAPPGITQAIAAYDEAIVGRADRVFNTYNYAHLIPFSGSPTEMQARIQSFRKKVGAVAANLQTLWEREWKPEIEAIWGFWSSFDLGGATMEALNAHLHGSLEHATRLYTLHYQINSPMWFAIDEFETCYCDLFPGKSRLDAHVLLQGFDNKTLEGGRALWRLSRMARACLPVQQALLQYPAAEVETALAAVAEGRAFLDEVRVYLSTYGRRSSLWDWGYPSWEEDPAPVYNTLKNYLAQPDRDLEAQLLMAAAEREVAIAQTRAALSGYPNPVKERFERLLKAAQVALVLTENHTYYMDFNGFGWLRRVIREFGKRFTAAGRLAAPNDIFYLKLEELEAMVHDPALDLRACAAARQAEIAQWSAYPAPVELGTRPTEPLYLYSPDARRVMAYSGGWVAGDDAAYACTAPYEAGVLRGQAGSSGRVRGVARVILTLDEAHRLQPGDILVTTTTAPPWTPLFLTAAALVTDAGGMLSHGAVVSREYRLPAVVGARNATVRIQDGQEIEVDGSNGVVYLL